MRNRKPTDICLLCKDLESSKDNSHLVPVGLHKNSIGKRNYEESHHIDSESLSIDVYYGRSNLKNPTTEIKENHHARDFIFCPECEEKLGELEGKVIPFLMDKLKDPKYASSIISKATKGGIPYKEITSLDSNSFQVFVYSVIWRVATRYAQEDGIVVLDKHEFEYLRHLIYSFLYKINDSDVEEILDFFGFNIFTSDTFDDSSRNCVVTAEHWETPNVFYFFEFMVRLYTSEETQNGARFIGDALNFCGTLPKIIIFPQALWNKGLDGVLKQAASGFLNNRFLDRLASMLSRRTGFSQEICKGLISKEAEINQDEGNGKEYKKDYLSATKRLLEYI